MEEHVPTLAVVGSGRRVPVRGRLYVGRECAGVEPERRLIVEDPRVSRSHLELHLGFDGQVVAFDTSSNGTLLNGLRLDRAVPTPLADGDVLAVGDTQLQFQAAPATLAGRASRTTVLERGKMLMVLVAADVIGSTELAERTASDSVATVMGELFSALSEPLARHRGTLSHIAGDAMLAVWDVGRDEQGADRAVAYALEASSMVDAIAPTLPLRAAGGSPLRMGWGVSLGQVSISHLARGRSTVLGDPANIAFRLADLAGRDGRPDVLVTAEVSALVQRPVRLGPEAPLPVKGRNTPVFVRAVQR